MGKLTRMQVKLIRVTVWGHVIRNDIHTGHLVFFFPFHPPILEPNFDLSFCQTQRVRNFDSSSPRQVAVKMEFFFQLQSLVPSIWCSLTFGFTICVYSTWNNEKTIKVYRQISKRHKLSTTESLTSFWF